MKNFITELLKIYLDYAKKLTSLRLLVVFVAFTLLTKALSLGLISGSDYVKGITLISGLYLAGRTITHFRNGNEAKSN